MLKHKPKIIPALILAAIGCMHVSQAWAQTPTNPSEIAGIYSCKSIEAPDDRLACYDKAVGRLEAAQASGDVVAVSKSEIEKIERESFGFNIPSLPKLGQLFGIGKSAGNSDKATQADNNTAAAIPDPAARRSEAKSRENTAPARAAEPKKPASEKTRLVILNLAKTQSFGHEKKRFFFENGQVWEQTSTGRVRVPKARGGKPVTGHISRASLGSYLMRLNGKGQAIRVRRVR